MTPIYQIHMYHQVLIAIYACTIDLKDESSNLMGLGFVKIAISHWHRYENLFANYGQSGAYAQKTSRNMTLKNRNQADATVPWI